MAKSGGKPAVIGEINITPLTDIFLVLLIIMMVVTPLLDFAGLQATATPKDPQEQSETPPPDKPKSDDKKTSIAIAIDNENKIKIDGEEITIPSIQNLIDAIAAVAPDRPEGVTITVSAKAELQYMTRTMEACREAGIQKVQVVRGK